MAMPTFTMRQLFRGGSAFWTSHPSLESENGTIHFWSEEWIHILDLRQSVPMLHAALQAVRDTVAGGGRVLFVGTKRQASEQITEAAERCGQYYVNHRWLGGMLTNWRTITD